MSPRKAMMNDAVHQFLQLILQGLTWVLRTIEKIWVWSWSQIAAVFNMPWDNLPAWKMVIGVIALATLAVLLVFLFIRGMYAFRRIAYAFWTMAMAAVGIVMFVAVAGLFSRGFQWVVASAPDSF